MSSTLIKSNHKFLRQHKGNYKKAGLIFELFSKDLFKFSKSMEKTGQTEDLAYFIIQMSNLISNVSSEFSSEHKRLKIFGSEVKACKATITKTMLKCNKEYKLSHASAVKL